MKFVARWSEQALDDLRRLQPSFADRITGKVNWYCLQRAPLSFAKPLGGRFEDVYRFRVGDYRILFETMNGKITILMILRIKHRRDAYR